MIFTKALIGVIILMDILVVYYIIVIAKECYEKYKKTGKWI